MTEPVLSSRPATLNLSLDCDLAQVRQIAQETSLFLAGQGCSRTDCLDCELALVEACNNAIQYAPANCRKLPIQVKILCYVREIECRITDHTPGFDWPAKVDLPGPDSERGRGLYLIHALMDYCGYVRDKTGNTLVLRRKRRRES